MFRLSISHTAYTFGAGLSFPAPLILHLLLGARWQLPLQGRWQVIYPRSVHSVKAKTLQTSSENHATITNFPPPLWPALSYACTPSSNFISFHSPGAAAFKPPSSNFGVKAFNSSANSSTEY